MKKYWFHPEAFAELEAAADWYERNRTGLGQDFLDAIASSVGLILEHPGVGPVTELVETREIRRALVGGFPYGLVYYTADDELRIIAVAHTKRVPRYWRTRLPPSAK